GILEIRHAPTTFLLARWLRAPWYRRACFICRAGELMQHGPRRTRDKTPGLEPGTSARAESVHPRHAHGGHVAMQKRVRALRTMPNTRQCPNLKIGTFCRLTGVAQKDLQ